MLSVPVSSFVGVWEDNGEPLPVDDDGLEMDESSPFLARIEGHKTAPGYGHGAMKASAPRVLSSTHQLNYALMCENNVDPGCRRRRSARTTSTRTWRAAQDARQ